METTSHVIVQGTRRAASPGAKVLGPAEPDQTIEVTVKVRRANPLPGLEDRPAKPLSREEETAKYGATDSDLQKVADAFGKYGLKVVHTDRATRSVDVSGPIRAMQEAFQVKLFRFQHTGGEFRGRSGSLHVPSELDGIVTAIYGLDNRRVIRRRKRMGSHAPIPHDKAMATKKHPGFVPADLARLYQFPPGDGAGQCVGILEFGGGFLPSDLKAFCKDVGLTVPKVVSISVDDASTTTDDGAAFEVMLDVEIVAGVCPKASIALYFGPDLSERSLVDTVDRAIHDATNNPQVLSISWGDFEESSDWSAGTLDHVNDAFHEAALLGVTICVAAGDDGSDDGAGDGHAHVDFPASSPYVLAVGGTDLRVASNTSSERVWKDGDGRRPVIGGTGGSTGGGVSSHFARPTFQKGINIKSVNPGAIKGRVVPDVAAHAETDQKTTGYFQVTDGNAFLDGGTSASAPLWASLIALLNAELQKQKGPSARVGYLTPLLYKNADGGKPLGASVCRDITEGDNISAAGGGYRAQTGYDAVTGWGSPIGTNLLSSLLTLT